MNQFDSLHALLAVVDHGGFAAAARSLDTSRAKVTRLIQDLEESLHTRLLNRTTRTLSLTEAGQLYVRRIRPVINELRAVNDEVSTYNRLPSGVLKVHAPLDFAASQLIPRIPQLQHSFPKLEVEMHVSDKMQASPELDADVTFLITKQSLGDSSFIARKIGTTAAVLCASPHYIQAKGLPEHPRDLQHHDCLMPLDKNLPDVLELARVGAAEGGRLELRRGSPRFHSSSPEALRHAALNGMGLVGMLSAHAEPHIRNGSLVHVLPQWRGETWTIWCAYSGRRHVSRKLQAFIEFLRQEFGDPEQDAWLQALQTPDLSAAPPD